MQDMTVCVLFNAGNSDFLSRFIQRDLESWSPLIHLNFLKELLPASTTQWRRPSASQGCEM